MRTAWRVVCAVSFIALVGCVGAIENGAPLIPGFIAGMVCVTLFGISAKLGGLMYE